LGSPTIDGVLNGGEWTLHNFSLKLATVSGNPNFNYSEDTLNLRVGVATNPHQIFIAVRIEGIPVFAEDYIHRLFIAADNGECQTEGTRGYVVQTNLDRGAAENTSYMHVFRQSFSNASRWWMAHGDPLSRDRKIRVGVQGRAGMEGNYTYETNMPYYLARGDSTFALTRTAAFRLQIIFQVWHREAPYVWTYLWPNNTYYKYIYSDPDHGFDPAIFEYWCLVTTQWTEIPSGPQAHLPLIGIGVAAAVLVCVLVIWRRRNR